jgi:hypothetical protein
VGVEGAVGEPGVGHQSCDAGPVDAVALEPATSRLDDAPTRGFLVLDAVTRHAFLHFLDVTPCPPGHHTL